MTWKKTPKVAEWHIFGEVADYNKTNHPIRFFFVDTLPDMFHQKIYNINQFGWSLVHRFHHKHKYNMIPTGLKPGYYDIPSLMTHGMFTFLERYVDGEKCFERINWDSDPEHACAASEIEDLYYWWMNIRPLRKGIKNELYEGVDNTGFVTNTPLSDNTKIIYNELGRLVLRWNSEDKYNLKRLVMIKDYMWT